MNNVIYGYRFVFYALMGFEPGLANSDTAVSALPIALKGLRTSQCFTDRVKGLTHVLFLL